MKRIVILIALILAPALLFAQTNAQQNEAGTTYLPNAGNISANIAVDRALRQIVTLSAGVAGANNPIKLDSAAGGVVGDALMGIAGVRNEGPSVLADSNLDYIALGTDRWGGLYVDIDSTHQVQSTTGLLKNEDVAAGNGDAGVAFFATRNSNGNQISTGADGDYTALSSTVDGGLWVATTASSAGGVTVHRVLSAATNNSTNVKAAIGNLYSLTVCNTNAAIRYLKLYNKASAPTCGTDTPVMSLLLPPTSCASSTEYGTPLLFSLGIGYCMVTGATDADNTAVAATDILLTMGYK